jgi:hypothetical protein
MSENERPVKQQKTKASRTFTLQNEKKVLFFSKEKRK